MVAVKLAFSLCLPGDSHLKFMTYPLIFHDKSRQTISDWINVVSHINWKIKISDSSSWVSVVVCWVEESTLKRTSQLQITPDKPCQSWRKQLEVPEWAEFSRGLSWWIPSHKLKNLMSNPEESKFIPFVNFLSYCKSLTQPTFSESRGRVSAPSLRFFGWYFDLFALLCSIFPVRNLRVSH